MHYFRQLIFVIILSLVSPCLGTVTPYMNKAAWQADAGAHTTITFAEVPDGTVLSDHYSALGALFVDGNDYTDNAPSLFPNDGFGARGNFDGVITIEFLHPMYVVAVEHPGSVQFELYLNGRLTHLSIPFVHGGVGFFSGLISTEPFDKIRIFDPTDSAVSIDDLHFGPPIPGPGAVALLLGAAAAMTRTRRRNR